jgi:hypothetical protein
VGAGEVLAAALITFIPERPAAVVALAAYLALTAVAYSLRGQECACFGVARLASVGRLHIVANAAGAVLAAVVTAIATSGAGLAPRLGGAAVAGAATFGLVLLADQTRSAGSLGDCADPVAAVHLYVSSSCPSCRAVSQMLASAEPARRDAVTITELGPGQRPPEHFGSSGVPCAVGLSAEGEESCGPAFGLGPVWALIERIVIGLGVHAQ